LRQVGRQAPGSRLVSALLLAALLPPCGVSTAASIYKYRDANGNLVYAEQKPDAATASESIAIAADTKTPRILVERIDSADGWLLKATNECLCVVEFEVRVRAPGGTGAPANAVYHDILQPRSEKQLAQGPKEDAAAVHFTWKAVIGTPGAQHDAREPYRAPFAIGASFLISQAYPTHFTHDSPESQYAIDVALPDGTPVYAARDGTVINLRHDSFFGAPTPIMLDQANMVEILHDDGTIAMYAHLHWDSVRVQPGQHVRRGEYIADSGNTGFSTGPHLHFAVIRNAGLLAVSVPIQFSGPSAAPVTPQQGMLLTAY
jgi:murein DD-endopeptidase MepM/ murein hydrolase activator NlpD